MLTIPNYLQDELNKRLDAEFVKCPEAEKDRGALYAQLIEYVDEHGVIPDFSLAKNPQRQDAT